MIFLWGFILIKQQIDKKVMEKKHTFVKELKIQVSKKKKFYDSAKFVSISRNKKVIDSKVKV